MKKKSKFKISNEDQYRKIAPICETVKRRGQNVRVIKWNKIKGQTLTIIDRQTGRRFAGTVRIKAVRCGKPTCKKCPHYIYAYARFRDGKRVREKYLGIAR